MKKILFVIDWQNDFVDGTLGTPEALAIKEAKLIEDKLRHAEYDHVIFTKDTHYKETYENTSEGGRLPAHVIFGTPGHDLVNEDLLMEIVESRNITPVVVMKETFGAHNLVKHFKSMLDIEELMLDRDYDFNKLTLDEEKALELEFVGVCTDICVISNLAIMKASFPNAKFFVDEQLCAGATPEAHNAALTVFKSWGVEPSKGSVE